MKSKVNTPVAVGAIVGVVVLVGAVFMMRGRTSQAAVAADAKRGESGGQQMMQFMQNRGPNSQFNPQAFRPAAADSGK